jgi:hypothetical protein
MKNETKTVHMKYVGDDEHNLAQVGVVQPGQVFPVSEEIADELEKRAPDLYERVKTKPALITNTKVVEDGEEEKKPVVPVSPPKANGSGKPGPEKV